MGNPLFYYDPYGLYSWDEFVDDSANYSAGFGDTLSFGLTSYIRGLWDIGSVNKCSGAYSAGMYTDIGLEVALTGVSFALRGAAKNISQAAARRGQNWHGVRGVTAVHHINPLKTGLFPTASLPKAFRHSPFNLQLLATAEHTATHNNLVRNELYLMSAINPATTTGRVEYAVSNNCGCK